MSCALVMSFDYTTTPGTYAIRGTAIGLEQGQKVALVLNGGERVEAAVDIAFSFTTKVEDGKEWVVTADADGHKCEGANGRVSGADVTATIRCLSTNANLAELSVSPGELRAIDSTHHQLTFEKPLGLITGITTNLTARAASPSAKVTARGAPLLANPTPVVFGGGAPFSLEIAVTAAAAAAAGGPPTQVFIDTKFAPTAYIKPSNTPAIGQGKFGSAIALDGSYLAAAGGVAVYIFRRAAKSWMEEAILKPSHTASLSYGGFGASVALSGETIAVGDSYDRTLPSGEEQPILFETGAVYIFRRQPSSGAWTEEAFIKAAPPKTGSRFGTSIALDGDTLAVASPLAVAPVQVFRRTTGTTWALEQSLSSVVSATSLALHGDELVIGTSAGAYVYRRTGVTWSEIVVLRPETQRDADRFGSSVSFSSDTLAIGAPGESLSAGAVHVYRREAAAVGAWLKDTTLKASNAHQSNAFGTSVVTSAGGIVIVGSPVEPSLAKGLDGDQQNQAGTNAGALYFFTARDQRGYIKAPNTRAGAELGSSLAFKDGTLVSGSPGETGATSGVNGDMELTGAPSGAVYVW